MSGEPAERKRTRSDASVELTQSKCRRNSIQDTAAQSAVSSPLESSGINGSDINAALCSTHISQPEFTTNRIRRRAIRHKNCVPVAPCIDIITKSPESSSPPSQKRSSTTGNKSNSNHSRTGLPPPTQEEVTMSSPTPSSMPKDGKLRIPSSESKCLLQPPPNKKLVCRQSTSTAAPAETTGGSEEEPCSSKSPGASASNASSPKILHPSKVTSPKRRSLPTCLTTSILSSQPSAAPTETTVHAPTASRFRHSLPTSSVRRAGTLLPSLQPRCVYPDELLVQMTRDAKRLTPINYLEAYKKVKGGIRINAESRRLIVHYMLDVTNNIANPVSQFSAHMAAALFDRYLSWVITSNDTQLQEAAAAEVEVVGAACLYIASKLEDTWSLCLSDVCRTFDGGSTDRDKAVLKWELRISSDFGFEFNAPTAVDFMHPMLQRTQDAFGPLPSEVKELAFLAADEALLCAGCLGVAAHVVAAAALLIAVTEVHGKAHRTSNLPAEVRELLGADRKQLCGATGVLSHSLGSHPAFRAFKRRQEERSGGGQVASSPYPRLSLSQESSFSPSSPPHRLNPEDTAKYRQSVA